jgi:hypothetical protein
MSRIRLTVDPIALAESSSRSAIEIRGRHGLCIFGDSLLVLEFASICSRLVALRAQLLSTVFVTDRLQGCQSQVNGFAWRYYYPNITIGTPKMNPQSLVVI